MSQMMVFPSMLVDAGKAAGMKVPPDPDDFPPQLYQHFQALITLHSNRNWIWGQHWDNARVIAEIPHEELPTITWDELKLKGFRL